MERRKKDDLPPVLLGVRTFKTCKGDLAIQTDLRASEYGDVWKAGLELASYLEMDPSWVEGKKVLELGSGVGYLGLICALLGASQVTLTDQSPLLPVSRPKGIERFKQMLRIRLIPNARMDTGIAHQRCKLYSFCSSQGG
mmetsp:Transcript_1999/g.4055  ORF Transcript_1999/g.4055 Transcript_1999/m.4055 type:complete len:140 (-) Transcript_1999:389-808(-)